MKTVKQQCVCELLQKAMSDAKLEGVEAINELA